MVITTHFKYELWASLMAQMVKNLPAMQRWEFDPWVRKTPWRRESQPTPGFLPGKSHGQRSLTGCSPWGHKELDTTKLEKEMSTHSSTLAWKVPWMREPGRLKSMGLQRVEHD